MKCKRKKKFIGAAISAAVAIGSAIMKAQQQKKAAQEAIDRENKQFAIQEAERKNQHDLQQVQALNQSLANQDYVDEYYDRLTFKCGGKVKKKLGGNAHSSTGRRKYAYGTTPTYTGNIALGNWQNNLPKVKFNANATSTTPTGVGGGFKFNAADLDSTIGAVGTLGSSLIDVIAANNMPKAPINIPTQYTDAKYSQKQNLVKPDYLRCGGKRKRKKSC